MKRYSQYTKLPLLLASFERDYGRQTQILLKSLKSIQNTLGFCLFHFIIIIFKILSQFQPFQNFI